MYQINLSTDRRYDYWIDFIDENATGYVKSLGGVYASGNNGSRVSLCYAVPSDKKNECKRIIFSSIVECFIVKQKKCYFNLLLNLSFCDVISRQMLINTLSIFNATAERLLVSSRLKLTADFNLDGFYDFKLKSLKSQWQESVDMILNNSEIVKNEQSFNVMLKVLLSGIDAKIKVVQLSQSGREFLLKNQCSKEEIICIGEGQLLVKLAEIAPEKIILSGAMSNKNLRRRLGEIFCLKEKNCEKV